MGFFSTANSTSHTNSKAAAVSETLEAAADHASIKAHEVIDEARDSADRALDALSGGLDDARRRAPRLLNRVADEVEHLARRGADGARAAGSQVREQLHQASDRTTSRIQAEPLKAVALAAAAGMVLTLIIGALSRPRSSRSVH